MDSGQRYLWSSDGFSEDPMLSGMTDISLMPTWAASTATSHQISSVNAPSHLATHVQSVAAAPAGDVADVLALEWPATEDYDFRLVFPEETIQECVPRSRRSHYSLQTRTLYVKEEQPCPFTFHCNGLIPGGACLRAMMKYVRREDMRHVVRRCKDHSVDEAGGCHVLRCRDSGARYESADCGRSVLLPFHCGQLSEDGCYTFTFEFVCLSTCRSPLKQKPMEIVFSLELSGSSIGTDGVITKVCSSPYRDMSNAERKCRHEVPHDAGGKKADKPELQPLQLGKKRKSVGVGAEEPLTVPVCDMIGDSDLDYERRVREDVAFAQFARKRRPQWWDEYNEEMRLLQLKEQRAVDDHYMSK